MATFTNASSLFTIGLPQTFFTMSKTFVDVTSAAVPFPFTDCESLSVIENDAEDRLELLCELAREENLGAVVAQLTSSDPNWSLTFEELKGGRSCLIPGMECRGIWNHTDKVAAKKHYSNQSHLAWDRKMAREAARLPPAVPSPLPRPDLRPTMVIAFPPPPWRPGPLLFRDSQEDQDDILFSPLPKGTVIPDSEEDSDITFAHVLAKRLYNSSKRQKFSSDTQSSHTRFLGSFTRCFSLTLEDAAGFRVENNALNESGVRALVLKATSLRPELPVTSRVDYFPFMMNGTSMAHPHGITGCKPLSPTQNALVDMPSITILGLPSLHRDNTNKRIIALPTPIAKLSFNPIQSIMDETQVLGGLHIILRDGDIGEIEGHVLQLLPDPVQSPTEQSPAGVVLLRVGAAVARLKTELDLSQLAELFQPFS
ncbi:uncharacterized protein NECHADRAFT_85376 [Fusarium vanettenii 77-13-4]|uniref:Uncharacterized protein n=1 Tax=Fusarium vanettenii (strain ATCC MYA-4622 / CBS 123669 / FGSC 9596 / NRRL 45880 / 77-13-4) TaxID=660122 RepID=C7ZJ67_FUSV7|nr:uncharacterized protein NECHADRAFT_85376 [Fusarium vanettenii 77-13-4]EEU36023.1 predicted protein [Fusarium vanettenii 77-13-4]